jgi:hypothetical protein
LAARHSAANHYSACDFHASLTGAHAALLCAAKVHEHSQDVQAGDPRQKLRGTMLGTILIIILILLLIGALPTWPYSAGWGYYPGGGLGLLLIIVVVLILLGRI